MFTDINLVYEGYFRSSFRHLYFERIEPPPQSEPYLQFKVSLLIESKAGVSRNKEEDPILAELIEKFDSYRSQNYTIKDSVYETINDIIAKRKIKVNRLIIVEGNINTLLTISHLPSIAQLIGEHKGYKLFLDYLDYLEVNKDLEESKEDNTAVKSFFKSRNIENFLQEDRIECRADAETIQKHFQKLVKHEVLEQEEVDHILSYAFRIFNKKVEVRKFTPKGIKKRELMNFMQVFYSKYALNNQKGANQWIDLLLLDSFSIFENPQKSKEQIREDIKDNWSKGSNHYRFGDL